MELLGTQQESRQKIRLHIYNACLLLKIGELSGELSGEL